MHYNKFTRTGNPLSKSLRSTSGDGFIHKGYRYFTVNGEKISEHRLIVEKVIGKKLPENAVIHHADENRLNNENSNLVVCQDNKYHRLIHQRLNSLNACGNANWRKCPYCQQYDDIKNMNAQKCGRFIHNACSAKSRRESRKQRKIK